MKQIIIEQIKAEVKLMEDAESSLKAIATITLGPLKIKGFQIRDSDFKNRSGDLLWVTPPSYKSNVSKKFHRTFHSEDKKLWEEIEDKILEEYKRKKELADIPVVD